MDFAEFERLVLRVLFETNVPLTASHIAYLGGLSVKTAERHLARMAEDGTLLLRANGDGQVEYYFPAGVRSVPTPPPRKPPRWPPRLPPPAREPADGGAAVDAESRAPATSTRVAPAPASPGWQAPWPATRSSSCRVCFSTVCAW
jgi:hypothetical protein